MLGGDAAGPSLKGQSVTASVCGCPLKLMGRVPSSPCGFNVCILCAGHGSPTKRMPTQPALPLNACSLWAQWTSCPPALLPGGVGGQQAAIIRSLTSELRSAALGAARTSLTGDRAVSSLDRSSWTVQPPRIPRREPPWPHGSERASTWARCPW